MLGMLSICFYGIRKSAYIAISNIPIIQ